MRIGKSKGAEKVSRSVCHDAVWGLGNFAGFPKRNSRKEIIENDDI